MKYEPVAPISEDLKDLKAAACEYLEANKEYTLGPDSGLRESRLDSAFVRLAKLCGYMA